MTTIRDLYDIDARVASLMANADPDTGELTDADASALEALAADSDELIEQIALYIKNVDAELMMVEAEAANLRDRCDKLRRRRDNTVRSLDRYMTAAGHEGIKTARCVVKYTKSKAVEIFDADEFSLWAAMNGGSTRETVTVAPDKRAIGDALKAGENIPGAALVERRNLKIT